MVIYYVIYALLIFAGFFQKSFDNSKKAIRNYCIFVFLIIAGMLALRHPSMGVDLAYGKTSGYIGAFSRITSMTWKQVFTTPVLNYEKGYVIFCKLIGYISGEAQMLLISCAVIAIALITVTIYKYSNNPMFSFIIYLGLPCFLMNYSGLRQALAISITTFSLKYIEKKAPIKFIAAVLLAACFHSSAIVFLFAYPLYNIKFSKNMQYFSVALIPIVFLFRYPLFGILSKLFKPDAVTDDNNAVTLFIVFTLIYIFTIIVSDNEDPLENGSRNLFWVACICQAFGGINSIAIRVGYYFMIFLAILLPKVATRITFDYRNKNILRDSILSGVIYFCFIAFGLYSLYRGSWAMSNPYHFFWQDI